MAIIVFQHSAMCGPGRIGVTFRDHAQKLDIRRLDLPESPANRHIPPDFDNVDGVISLGGPQNVGDPLPWMDAEMNFLREAHQRGLPVVGVCLGAQLIAAALGGKVALLPRPEWGFPNVSQLPVANTDTILAGIPWTSRQFQAHAQGVSELPPGATLLQTSEACKVQSFRVGMRTYAFQYHFECDREMVNAYAAGSGGELAAAGLDTASFTAQADEHYPRFAILADRLSVNIVSYLFPSLRRIAI